MRALLWLAGLFQSYRLFDWVDERNYHARYEVRSLRAGRERSIEPRKLFPESMRHLLLQSYFLGNVWLQMEPEKLAAVRRSLLERHAPQIRARATPMRAKSKRLRSSSGSLRTTSSSPAASGFR